jgi:hypothetical protein
MNTDINEAKIFETRLRTDIEKRTGKAPDVPQKEVERFVKYSIKLRFEPACLQATKLLDRILGDRLFLLSDGNWEQYDSRLRGDIEAGPAQKSAAPDTGTQADSAAGVQASDSLVAVQPDRVGQDVTNDSLSKSAIRKNGKLEASTVTG